MARSEEILAGSNNLISVIELKQLMINLKDKKPSASIRFRLLGELWATSFMSIIATTERGVLLKDDVNNRFIAISNLADIIQFEIDEPFQGYRPYNHYDVTNLVEF